MRGKVKRIIAFIIVVVIVISADVAIFVSANSQVQEIDEEPLKEQEAEPEPELKPVEKQEKPQKPEELKEVKEPKEEDEPIIGTPNSDAPNIRHYTLDQLSPKSRSGLNSITMETNQHSGDHNNIEPPAPGSLDIDKRAEPVEGSTNRWKINLTLTGKDIPKTSDIVLVIDRSGSMGDNNKMTEAKVAAKSFVNTILADPEDTNTRIAIVSFSSNNDGANALEINSGFTGAEDKQSLLDAIDSLRARGGTFIQAGLKQANEMLNASTADYKNIVLLGDGAATFSYGMHNPDNYLEYWYTSWGVDRYITSSAIPYNEYNYNSVVGNGRDYYQLYKYGRYYEKYYNHGNSTIAEAGFAEAAGQTIYTIALQAGTEGERTLRGIANEGNYYTANPEDLQNIFQEIAGRIAYAATNATVTDPMGEMFSIPGINSSNYMEKITVNRGTINWNDKTETITWNLDTISEGNPATMSYIVEIEESAESGVTYPTNKHTYVNYTNVLDEGAKKSFPIPRIGIDARTITIHYYKVNEEGQPINSQGQVIKKEQAVLQSLTYREGENLKLNKPYEITGPETVEIGGIKYSYNPVGNVGDENPAKIMLTPQSSSRDVYFAYMENNIDYSIEKSVDKPSATIGDELIYTITVTNTGNSTFHEIKVTDTIPAGITILGVSEDNGATWRDAITNEDGDIILDTDLSLSTVESENSKIYLIKAYVNENVVDGQALINTAKIDGAMGPKTDTAKVTIKATDVTVKKLITGNSGDVSREFSFIVTTAKEGHYETKTLNFDLSHEDSYVLSNLPTDAVLKLIEEDRGYDVTVTVGGNTIDPNNNGEYLINLSNMDDTTITVTNHKDMIIDTGISFNSLPYALILALVVFGLGVKLVRKHNIHN